jgi:hypothetical protein
MFWPRRLIFLSVKVVGDGVRARFAVSLASLAGGRVCTNHDVSSPFAVFTFFLGHGCRMKICGVF